MKKKKKGTKISYILENDVHLYLVSETTLSTVFQKLVDRWCILNRDCIAVVLEKFESTIDPPLQEEDFSLAQVLERGKKMGDDSWKGGGKKSWGGPRLLHFLLDFIRGTSK